MNKTENGKNLIFFLSVLSVFCLFLCSCGMQEYFSLDAPVASHKPNYSSSEYTNSYFRFKTASNSDSGEFRVLGTAVYYKIYGSSSTLESHVNSIESVNTHSNGSTAARRLIESYGYKPLGTTAGSRNPFISGSSSRVVYIRLMSYGDDAEYMARVIIDGAGQAWLPVRYDNSNTFEFGRGADSFPNHTHNVAPSSSDDDVTGTATNNVWYVNMYAFSVARDSNYSSYYSLVEHLGSVKISADSEDNPPIN